MHVRADNLTRVMNPSVQTALARPGVRSVHRCARRVTVRVAQRGPRLRPDQLTHSKNMLGGRVDVDRARLRAVFGGGKTFSHGLGGVEMWRGGFRLHISVSASFVWRCLSGVAVTPFPHPARRTGQAALPHPALGQDLTPSPTACRAQARLGVRARSARKGARVDRPRPCIA